MNPNCSTAVRPSDGIELGQGDVMAVGREGLDYPPATRKAVPAGFTHRAALIASRFIPSVTMATLTPAPTAASMIGTISP